VAPQSGSGFTVADRGSVDIVNADTVTYTHNKTGARVIHIANDDKERALVITFETPALDNKGIPHVFEHATLGGSEKYPSPALFLSAARQTYNTGMNASTQNAMTSYYYMTRSEEQLLAMTDFYMDSVFHPMLLTDERIFRRESWRYELTNPSAPLNLNGIVYSEMRGAMTPEFAARQNMLDALYPGSVSANNYGGNPTDVLKMTYEDCVAFHGAYYHPSNCIIFLYGDLDAAPFLDLIGGYCDGFGRRDIYVEKSLTEPFAEPVTKVYSFPAEANGTAENNAILQYAVSLGKLTPEELGAADMLAAVLMKDASPVIKGLREALPGINADISLGSETAGDYLYIQADGANGADLSIFKDTVETAVAEILANGFDPELIEAAIASEEFAVLTAADYPGAGARIAQVMASYNAAGNGLDYWNGLLAGIERAKAGYKNGLFEDFLRDYVKDNPHRALVATVPAPGLKEAQDAELRKWLDNKKAGMSDEEIQSLIEQSDELSAMAEESAPAELLDKLTAVTVGTLPIEVKEYRVIESVIDGVPVYCANAEIDGVNSTSVIYNAQAVEADELHWLKLYAYLLGNMPTKQYNLSVLQTKIARYLNGFSVSAGAQEFYDHTFQPSITLEWSGLNGDYAEAAALAKEILTATDISDTSLIAGYLNQIKTETRYLINAAPHSVMQMRAKAARSDYYAYINYMNNVDYYDFIDAAEELLSADPDAFNTRLETVRGKLNYKEGAAVIFAGDAEGIELFNKNIGGLLAHLTEEAIVPADLSSLPRPADTEGMVIESSVQYNTLYASLDDAGLEYNGKLLVNMSVLGDAYMLNVLRYRLGAYSAMARADRDGLAFISYRDPQVKATFSAYEEMADFVRGSDITQADIDRYIISVFSAYAEPRGELTDAVDTASKKYLRYPDGYLVNLLEGIKSASVADFKGFAPYLDRVIEKGTRSTAGGQTAIQENAELYEDIIYPF
jgi:Zn-dependent M16 (insulinase) family peptidase